MLFTETERHIRSGDVDLRSAEWGRWEDTTQTPMAASII